MKLKNNKYIFYWIGLFQGMVFYAAYSVIYREAHGLNLQQIFLLEGILLCLMLAMEIPWGILSDRIGYRKTLIFSSGIYALSKIAFMTASGFSGFLLEAVLSAIACSGISGCDSALLYMSVDKEESEKVFGRYGACGAVGLFISSVLSGYLVTKSINLLAVFTTVTYGIAFVLTFFLEDTKKEKEDHPKIIGIVKDVLKDKEIMMFLIAMAIISESTHGICVFLNQPLYLRSGIDLKWLGMLTALMQVTALTSAFTHRFTKKAGERKVLIVGIALITITNVVLIWKVNSVMTVLMILMIEAMFSIVQPITQTIENETVKIADRATVLSVYAMITELMCAGINVLISFAGRYSLEVSTGACALLDGIALCILLVGFQRKRNV